MLFNFEFFIEELRQNPEKKDNVENYENIYGKISGDLYDQIWFIDYVSKFLPFYEAVKSPKELEQDFEWPTLFALIVSSFSSDIELEKPNKVFIEDIDQIELLINVRKDDQKVTKKLSDLWGFQVLRLFEIYCEEQMNLQTLIAQDGMEMSAIYKVRLNKLDFIRNYNPYFKRLDPGKRDNKESLIYHYTSFNTINEILKNNSLRACDLKRLNDRNEHKIWFDVFDQVIAKFSSKEDYTKYDVFLESIINEISKYKKFDCFVTCFSFERDLLSQWRAYGDDGQGICIAFEVSTFLSELYKHNDPNNEFKLLHGQLEYNYEKVHNDIYKIIQDLIHSFIKSKLTCHDFFNMVDKKDEFHETCKNIYLRMQDLKDSSFFEEREFRLFYQFSDDKKEKQSFERNKRLIPFVNLSFGETKIPIKEIILGPALADKEEKIENLKDVLRYYGYQSNDIILSVSKLPYRL